MAEVIEYTLVVAASMVVVVFSLGFYASFSNGVAYSEERADFASITTVAMTSVEHGSSSVTLSFSGATVACVDGQISITSGSYNATAEIPTGCDFQTGVLYGTHTLAFATHGYVTRVEVS